MANKVNAETVFGQVLICLRMSKLDYLVKETPYAAYVTVRKKFNKSFDRSNSVNDVVMNDNDVLNEEVKDLKTTCALMRVEYEELEVKNESLNKDIAALDDRLEDAYNEGSTFKADLQKKIKLSKTHL